MVGENVLHPGLGGGLHLVEIAAVFCTTLLITDWDGVRVGIMLENCRKAESKKYIFHSKERFFRNRFNLIKADF